MILYSPMHDKSLEEVLSSLSTSIEGLSEEDAQRRLKTYGLNILEEERENYLKVFLRQFKSVFIYILLVAGVIALLLGDKKDAIFIYGIVFINSLIGFFHEVRAIKQVSALKKLTALRVDVVRDGQVKSIDASLLVPGDVVLMKEGDIVPADMRLIESKGLLVDEAILTGESIPVEKHEDVVLPTDTPVYERSNLLFRGTTVVRGKGKGVVYATGRNTYIGSIAEKAKVVKTETPLTKAVDAFSKRWVLVLILVLSLVFAVGVYQGRSFREMFLVVVAQLVSAVPEGFPIVLSLTLIVGAYRLYKAKTLIKYLPAAETLGSTTYICSDKTGTITEGRLRVEDYYAKDELLLRLCACLCNDADKEKGDPIDTALIRWLDEEGFNWVGIRARHPRVWELPFDTKLRMMATLNKNGDYYEFFVKGAFEALASISENTEEELQELKQILEDMASAGLRVLAFAHNTLEREINTLDGARVRIVGLVGFLDPPKEGVKEAVQTAKRAGIRVMMITGDHLLTAKAVAKMVDIYQEGDLAIEGMDVGKYTDEELYQVLKRTTVVARALPEDKFRIVKVLQERGKIVAVTGDGVNDVPALRMADIGIAMGGGSEAAKEASKMVLIENNLSVIVEGIRQGRNIVKNLSKVLQYLLTTNIFEVFYLSASVLLGLPLPLLAKHILWINLVTDGVQDKAFPFTKEEKDTMREKPRRPEEMLLGRRQIFRVVYNGLSVAVPAVLFFYYLNTIYPYKTALSISFFYAVVSQWFVGIQAVREEPFFLNPIKSFLINPYIYMGIGLGVILQSLAMFVFNDFFDVEPLRLEHLAMGMVIPVATFFLIELRKWVEHFIDGGRAPSPKA